MASSQDARHRKLFEKITHRGPKAYEMLLRILQQHSTDAYEILMHVSYRARYTKNENDDEPSIRELLNRNGLAGQTTIINNTSNINNNNNNDIHYAALPSTSRSISPRIQELSNQLLNASISNHTLPHRNLQVVEFKEQISPEMRVEMNCSTKFHGDTTSKVGVCKLNHLKTIYIYSKFSI